MYTPFYIVFNFQYGPYAHFGYWNQSTGAYVNINIKDVIFTSAQYFHY